MDHAQLNGCDLAVEVRGTGDPVVLIHGSHIADAFAPILDEPALSRGYRLIRYHRRGFADSTQPAGPLSIGQQAADCRALMDHLGVARAHIVGHSYGGAIAVQLALDAPGMVHSLALLEPALLMVPSAPQLMEALGPVMEMYAAGDKSGAVDGFLQAVVGPAYRPELDRMLPGAFAQAVADADTFFQIELPAIGQWDITQAAVGRITQPVLSVLGADSPAVWPGWAEVHQLVQTWLPQAEPLTLPDATHALQMINPAGMADGLASFFARHPLSHRA